MFQVLYVTNLIMVIALSAFGLRNAFGLIPCNLRHIISRHLVIEMDFLARQSDKKSNSPPLVPGLQFP